MPDTPEETKDENTEETKDEEEKDGNIQCTIKSARAIVYRSPERDPNATGYNTGILGVIPAGTRISVIGVGNGWYQITEILTGSKDPEKDKDDDTEKDEEEDKEATSDTDGDASSDDTTTDEPATNPDEPDTNDDNTTTDTDEEDKEEKDPLIGGYIQHTMTYVQYGEEKEVQQLDFLVDENGDPITGNERADQDEDEEDDEEEEDSEAPFYMDSNFAIDYLINNPDAETYEATLAESGTLTISTIRGIFGCPHQFLPIADMRVDSSIVSNYKNTGMVTLGNNDSLGRMYTGKIIANMPLLLITPGVPSFLSKFSESDKATAISNLLGVSKDDGVDGDLTQLIGGHKGKYYSLKFAYTSYFYYVNAMLRTAAILLEIDNEEIDGQKLGTFQWLFASRNVSLSQEEDVGKINFDIYGNEKLHSFLGPYAGCLPFYADCGNTVDDSFSNSTTQSQLASAMNSLSDTGRELNFLVGNVGSTLGLTLTKLTGMEDLTNNQEALAEIVDNALGSNNILSNILNKCQTILAGGRLLFPEIWADSSFSRSYNCKMRLVSPSGDKLSVFLNILVPFYHVLALTLPRQSIDQSYFSPFLVRAYTRSLFNVDMGIITDLNVTKGSEGEWTKDGLPTVAELSFTIKDLYDGMFMSSADDVGSMNILSNVSELDYIANSCGVNINDQEIGRIVKLYKNLDVLGRWKDKIQIGILGNITQKANQVIHNIFGAF